MSPNPDKGNAAPGSGIERLKRDVWAYSLTPIPTTLRRLVYLASLRDKKTGRYDGSQLAEHRGEVVDADLVLCELHEDVFGTWLSFSLEDQDEELKEHMELLQRENASDIEAWLTPAPYEALIPAQAGAAESQLFRSDLKFLLGKLKGKP